ncbi:MAG: DUF5666 domain-containing protein [Patescibacteria group bacterium]
MTNTYVAHGYKVGTALCAALVLAVMAFASSAFADSTVGLGVEVNIGSNGGALVRGARVTSVSGTDVSAKTSLGASVMNWLVKTDSDTDFSANKGGASGLAEIAVGDTISFRGTIDQAVSGLTVKAKTVKDWSSIEAKAKLEGVVTSISTSLNSFTVMKGNSTTTVQTNSSTKFTEDGDSASFADLFLNAKVKLQGMFNASSSVFTASSVAIETDSGEDNDDKWNKDDKKEWRNWIRSKIWLKLGH